MHSNRTFSFSHRLVLALLVALLGSLAFAADTSADEKDYYRIVRLPTPEGEVLETCGFQQFPDGRLALCTRRGDIWVIDQPDTKEDS
ncbi:MAG: hypothetical protein AAFP69_17150, partial [Planctomycetota bacterium]